MVENNHFSFEHPVDAKPCIYRWFFSKHNGWWTFNQSDCFKMMSFIKTTNQIALKVLHPSSLPKNSPLDVEIMILARKEFFSKGEFLCKYNGWWTFKAIWLVVLINDIILKQSDWLEVHHLLWSEKKSRLYHG